MFTAGVRADEPINRMCPGMPDTEVDPSITLLFEGHTIGFCCNMCRADFQYAPEEFVQNIAEDIAAAEAARAAPAGSASGADAAPAGRAPDGRNASAADESTADEAFLPLWVGKLHVIVIHFPLALLVAAAVAEWRSRRRGTAEPSPIATFCLAGGASMALIAAFTGWTRAESFTSPLVDELFLHRWLGVSVMSLSLLAWVLARRARGGGARGGEARGGVTQGGRALGGYRLCLYACAVATLATGHFGGTLVFGKGFLFG